MRTRGRAAPRFAEAVKEAAVQRYLSSDLTLGEGAEQGGADHSTVAYWVKRAETRIRMSKKHKQGTPVESAPSDQRSASEKLRLLVEAGSLSEEKLGEFLRREGIRDGDLERFRAEAMGGLGGQ